MTLNRPETMNAWNGQFGIDLGTRSSQVAGDESVRAVMITGAGRGFSSGADLRDVSGGLTTETAGPTSTAP